MSHNVDFYQKIRDGKYEKYNLTAKQVKEIGDQIGVDWTKVDFGEFMQGVKEELEHGGMFAPDENVEQTNVTGDDLVVTARIALAHLKEVTDYYTRLEKLEEEGDAYWGNNDPKEWIKQNKLKNADVLNEIGL